MSRILVSIFSWIHDFLHKPFKVVVLCLLVAFISLLLEGSLFQLWSLHRDFGELNTKIADLKIKNKALEMKIEKVTDPHFLEFEARDQFDMVEKGDLIFVFSESR